jgi:hypothetical protein
MRTAKTTNQNVNEVSMAKALNNILRLPSVQAVVVWGFTRPWPAGQARQVVDQMGLEERGDSSARGVLNAAQPRRPASLSRSKLSFFLLGGDQKLTHNFLCCIMVDVVCSQRRCLTSQPIQRLNYLDKSLLIRGVKNVHAD